MPQSASLHTNTDPKVLIQVQADKLHLLYYQSFPAVFISLLASLVLAGILWQNLNKTGIIAWLGILTFSSSLRLLLFLFYYRRAPAGRSTLRWETPYFITLLFSSLIWGLGAFLLMPADSLLYQAIIYFFLIGMSGGALSVYSAIRKFSLSAIGAVMGPATLWFLLRGELTPVLMGTGGLIFLLSALRATKVLSQTLHNNFLMTHTLAQAKGIIDNELDMARKIQKNLIPLRAPVSNMASIYIPMNKIGGDFFDIIPLSRGEKKCRRYGILMSDVSGHGIPAALVTMMIKSFLYGQRNALDEANAALLSPAELLATMNQQISRGLDGNFISALYAVVDFDEMTVTYAGAGHPPPLLLSQTNSEFIKIKPQGLPIGVAPVQPGVNEYFNHQLPARPGDKVLFYSDGLMDNAGFDFLNEQGDYESFNGTFIYDALRNHSGKNAHKFMEEISSELLSGITGDPLDDICALVVEF